MKPNDLIQYCGGSLTLAAATAKVTENTMRNWKEAGKIPHLQQRSIEVLTKGALKAEESYARIEANDR